MTKVAIGFFGITRSLKYTIKSIEENLFQVLNSNNIHYDIYLHTYYLSSYHNIRTNETAKSFQIDNNEYKLLNPTYFKQDNQDAIKHTLNLPSYRSLGDPWNTNYNSLDNFILGSYSKYTLTNMIKQRIQEYDYVLFMRPDCLYLDKFNINYLNLASDKTIAIPNFHLFGKYNINDRFAITNRKTYEIYGSIFKELLKLSKKYPLHSETIIGIILKTYGVDVKLVKFNFSRVRCDGRIVDKF